MNSFKAYNISKISYEDIDNLTEDYLKQVDNSHLKKVGITIKNENLEIDIEPYNLESNLWDNLIDLLKNKNVKFWFRDDDAGIDNAGLEVLLHYMNEQNIQLFIATIPTKVTSYLASIINNYSNVYVGQHGFSHSNHSLVEQSEYPKERDKKEVENELLKGRKILENFFETKFLNIFVPPWFEIDDATIEILKQENYAAISNFWDNNINEYGLIEANCQVDIVNWDNAYTFGGQDFVLSQIIAELIKDKKDYNLGILLHHERMGKESYDFLDKLIKIIRNYSSITSIGDVSKSVGEIR